MVKNPIGGASMTAWQTCQKPLAGNRVNQAGFRHPQTRTQANARAREERQTRTQEIQHPQPHVGKPSEAGSPQPKRPARALAGKPPGGRPKPGQTNGNQANAGGGRRGILWEGHKTPGEGERGWCREVGVEKRAGASPKPAPNTRQHLYKPAMPRPKFAGSGRSTPTRRERRRHRDQHPPHSEESQP